MPLTSPKHTPLRSALAVIVTIAALMISGARAASAQEIHWRSGVVETEFTTSAAAAQEIAAFRTRGAGAKHLVVQFDQPVTPAQSDALAQSGLSLLNYLGDNAYFAAVAESVDVDALAQQTALRAALAIERDWKLHPSLAADIVHPWAVVDPQTKGGEAGDPVVAVYVLFHRDVDVLTDGVQAAFAVDARIRSTLESINGLVLELPASAIKPLADDDRVQYIEPPLPQMNELNDSNRVITQADVVQAAPYGLTGAGVSVLVYDGGTVRATHSDFGGRATVRDTSGMSDHATHVAGTVGGSGAASGGLRRGMATGVTIESYGFEMPGGLSEGFLYTDPGDLQADYSQAINVHGVDISNNSIGTNTAPNGFPCEWEGNYGVTDVLIDTIVRGDASNPLFTSPFRVIWANGNERGSGRCGTTYNTTAPPACAKNHITVGALNSNDDSVTSFTSWGPADDGRLKPDVSAPGCQSGGDGGVTSCSSSGDSSYTAKCGTSMASPTMCGLSALFLQDFRLQYPGEPDPRNSTLKAIFAHTAQDIENVGPDYKSGYGSVRVQRAIDLMRAGNFLEDSVSQGNTFTATVVVAPGAADMRVTLAWDDVPGTPNVNPVLVNDLDLRVFDPNGTRHYPWTLNPASPATAAVRTQEDHVNNIEQVYVSSPITGAWTVEVRGTTVPQGPQPFSLSGTPLLVNCSDAGMVSLDRAKYACAATAAVRVVDCGLNLSDLAVDTVMVTVASTSEPAGESFLLIETAAETATFVGNVPLSTTDAAGTIWVAAGDTVTVTYVDADDGAGGVNIVVTDTALVDCTAPVITSVQATNLQPRSATITFNTSEPTTAAVRYGTHCAALTATVGATGLNTAHSVALTGLTDNTTYFFAVDAEDEAGNATTDNGDGVCYAFSTPDIPNFFTELFGAGNDLDNKLLTFTPNATIDQYHGCVEDITALPTDPAGGTPLSMTDDSFVTIDVLGGASVKLYGTAYTRMYPASNGYITFTSGQTDYTETAANHFSQPRISALYDDLNPASGGTVSYKQLADRCVVTWLNVPQYNVSGDQNTFQIEMYFDGTIRIAFLALGASDGLAGLSAGNGLDPDFFPTDLSAMGACGPQPPVATSQSTSTPANTPKTIVLGASDDGLPDPPAALSYTITSLPTKGALEDPNGGVIASAPYTLLAGGFVVDYSPGTNLYGADAFGFQVNDGGVPPEGGESNVATVAITIIADPPVTQFINVDVDINTTSLLALPVSDPNNDVLDVIIVALPTHGTLIDPNGGDIASAPYTLIGNGTHVYYAPDQDFAGSDTFAFKAFDGVFESNVSPLDILVVADPPVIVSEVLPHGIMGQPYGPWPLEKTGGQPVVDWQLITEPVYVEYDLGTSGFAEVGVAQGWFGDDSFWNLNLPFNFPYYSLTHNTVRVWSNGMLNFGVHTGSSHNNSTLLLTQNRRIAPLWDDLKTNVAGADIFVDTSIAGQVTVRWKAVTYLGTHAVNFSVELHENGDIVFHYGGGNAPITPTIGVSDGTLTSYTLSAYNGAASLTGANSVLLRIPVSLPAGMTIDAAGIVSGTPTESGVFEPVVKLTDSLARSDQRAVSVTILPDSGVAGDYDGDGDVDLADFAAMVECLYGPQVVPVPVPPMSAQLCLEIFDLNSDGDVDMQDMAGLEPTMTP